VAGNAEFSRLRDGDLGSFAIDSVDFVDSTIRNFGSGLEKN
jgi:hypothetical protein